ncbi:hypothetical protein K438DRAFT_1995906 [Mycena galopus ATCC 62051]|nr:hypothetical protein K438DRAFT_1995906 [Mycena galopus ATCC 62051]
MSDFEIIHSGQYWQDLRRHAKEAKAAQAERQAHGETSAPTVCDGGHIFTFVPGRTVPYTSVRHPNGKMVPVAGSSHPGPMTSGAQEEAVAAARLLAQQKRRRMAENTARAVRAKQLQQRVEDTDAALLARLQRRKKTGRVDKSAMPSKITKAVVPKPGAAESIVASLDGAAGSVGGFAQPVHRVTIGVAGSGGRVDSECLRPMLPMFPSPTLPSPVLPTPTPPGLELLPLPPPQHWLHGLHSLEPLQFEPTLAHRWPLPLG